MEMPSFEIILLDYSSHSSNLFTGKDVPEWVRGPRSCRTRTITHHKSGTEQELELHLPTPRLGAFLPRFPTWAIGTWHWRAEAASTSLCLCSELLRSSHTPTQILLGMKFFWKGCYSISSHSSLPAKRTPGNIKGAGEWGLGILLIQATASFLFGNGFQYHLLQGL